jgi:hypothetical protein
VWLEISQKGTLSLIWYGSNNVSSDNTSSGARNILQFVTNNSHTNIIVVNVPYRYALLESSYVTGEVALFNLKLEKSGRGGLRG